MKDKKVKKCRTYGMWKRFLAAALSAVMLLTGVDLTAFAYQADKDDFLTAVDKDGNEIVKEDASWEEQFPNGTFAFKNEYINLQESADSQTQKITVYRLGGTQGDAVAKIAVSPVVSYLDEEGTRAVYANAASNTDYTLEAEDPAGTSEQGEVTYSKVEVNTDEPYGTSFFDLTFAPGEWVKDVLVTPVDDEEHESQELALFTIYEAEGAEFTETANRTTISIEDDEEVLPSEMGFEVESVRMDKSENKAVVTVKRTGALQYVSSVAFATEDGTAKAGKDYAKAAGLASFSGDIDYYDIEVELIDNKEVSREDASFTIHLTDPKGGTIAEGKDTIRVDLYNSNTSEGDNLATKLQSPEAVDLTAQVVTEEKAITENKNQVVTEPDTKEEEIEAVYTPENEVVRTRSVVSDNTELKFRDEKGKPVFGNWKSEESDTKKVGTWKSEGADITFTDNNAGAEIGTNYDAYMALNIPGIANRFESIKWKVDCSTRKTLYWAYNYLSATYGALASDAFCYLDTGNMGGRGDGNMDSHINSEKSKHKNDIYGDWLFRYRGNQANGSGKGYDGQGYDGYERKDPLSVGSGKYDNLVFKIRGTKYDGEQRPRWGRIKLYDFAIKRRVVSNNPTVQVATPDDDDGLSENLSNVQPKISLEKNEGGMDGSEHLFMGSKLKIENNGKAGQYSMEKAVLTHKYTTARKILDKYEDEKTQEDSLWSADSSNPYIEIAYQKNKEKEVRRIGDTEIGRVVLDSSLKITTYLKRSQNLNIVYGPSLLNGETETQQKAKKKRIMANVTYTNKTFNPNTLSYDDTEGIIPQEGDDTETKKFVTKKLDNIKSINFHLDDGSLILYNGSTYSGNTDITIHPKHYNSKTITFQVYTPDAIKVERDPEIVSVNKASLYVDANDNGIYDASDLLKRDIPSEELCMDEFQPVDGHSLILKIDYTYTPACLEVPVGREENATFSLVPSFVNSLTEENVKEQLSNEMQGYRDILSKDGTAKMYGKTTEGTMSVPVGQDASPAKFNEQKKAYEWNPKWKGNLAKQYANPEKIVLDSTLMPDGFTAAATKEEINQYLGCLQGNDTLALTSRTEEKVTSTIQAGFTTYPEIGAQSFEQAAIPAMNAPVDTSGKTSNLPDAADTSPSLELPNMEIGVGPLSYIMGDDEIGFSVGIPITDGEPGDSKEENQDQLNQMKKAFQDQNVFQKLRERSRKYGPDNPGFEGGDMRGKSNEGSFEMAASATFMWKYNKKTANYEFSSAMMAVAVSGSVQFQYRFSACPIFYVYLSMGGELDMSTGLNVEVEVDENGNKKNNVAFAGYTLEPSVFIEAGAGVGIDIAKLEVYVHVSVSMAMSLNDDGGSFDKFETGAAVGFNAVFLFFSFNMDLVGCTAGYDKELKEEEGSDGWYFKWSLCGHDMRSRMARSPEDMPEIPGAKVTVELPKDTSGTQTFYTSDDNTPKDITPYAFDLDGMPFQTSGYGSSVASVKLADGLNSAGSYELLTVGTKNYLLYTISREHAARPTDASQLVLSELTTTSSKEDEVKGLANPVDNNAAIPYIVVDQKAGSPDSTGDLEFSSYVKDGAIYAAWTSYTEDAYDGVGQLWTEEQILAELSKHVSVKTASFKPGESQGFTDAREITAGTQTAGYRFLPKAVSDQVVFFGESEPYSKEELEAREKEYKEYYEAAAGGNTPDGTGGTGDPYANANYKYSLTLDSLYGQYSKLNFAVKQKGTSEYKNVSLETPDTWKEQGARIDYVRFMADTENSFYLAYATSQEEIKDWDKQTVKKLYLQKIGIKDSAAKEEGSQTILEAGAPALIKTLVDSELDDTKDGEYKGGTLEHPFTAPSFSNLKFLNGKLTSKTDPETFFLFGMNGMTYVINQENLDLMCSGRAGTISPFFQDEENGNSQSDTVIGADGDGNISAVYTDTVPNTVNNALFLTKYDPSVETFGDGIMLAMNHMQVYEDAQAGSWNAEETREAYYNEEQGGGMNKFSFAQPQIALGTPTTEEKQGTLTIVTQGTYTDLVRTTMQKPESGETVEEVIPDMTDGISGKMGVYALTYGVGKQSIGEEAIQFEKEEFVPGAKLNASVSFRNTGDVAIRAAEGDQYAASVRLICAKEDGSDGIELASWKILSNVLAGQQVTTDMVQTESLPEDIADRVLYFEVSENAGYITDGAFMASTLGNEDGLGKVVVGQRADVQVTELNIQAGPDMKRENLNGEDSVFADIDLLLENKGIQDAGNICIQVERTDGKDEQQENKYVPLSLGGGLITNGDEKLTGAGKDGSYQVVRAVDDSGKLVDMNQIPAGKSMRLQGKIALPISCFDVTSPGEAMNLRFTVLTDAKEYTQLNNTAYTSFAPVTEFAAPSNLNLTLGNTVNFNLEYTSAAAKNSNISATEMVLSSEGNAQEASAEEKLLEVLAYNPVNGMVSVRAGKTGSGIIRIADTATNSYMDLVFVNTASGTNISVENKALNFENSGKGVWKDNAIGRITKDAALPYNHDVCDGFQDGSFTFTTYASSIDLHFSGKALVSSKNSFGFGSVIVEGSGKSTKDDYFEPVTIDFKNSELKKHEVTITVLGQKAQFDKLVEKYGTEGDVGEVIPKDTEMPKIILGKSLPGTGKLQKGTSFEMPVYIYDNMAVNSVSIDGGGADTYLHQGFAQSVLHITENRNYRIIAVDSSGNRASYDIPVDWFDTDISTTSARDPWPDSAVTAVDEQGQEINEFTNGSAYIRYQVTAPAGIQSIKVQEYHPDTGAMIQLGETMVPGKDQTEAQGTMKKALPGNGYYRVEVEDGMRRVSSRIFYLDCLSKGPDVNLYLASNEPGKLFYSVGSDSNEVSLEKVAIYKGQVAQTDPDSLEVTGHDPIFTKDYAGKDTTWDTGTIPLKGTTVYTIMAKDVSGRIRTFVYSDTSSLSGLAVHADGYDLEMEPFSPYQYDYHVTLPYGYPENQLPAVEYKVSDEAVAAGAEVTQNAEENKVTVTLTCGEVTTDYVITFEREICTCAVDLAAYDSNVIIPYDQETVEGNVDIRVSVSPCTVKGHEGITEKDVKYHYEILEGRDYIDLADDGTVTYKAIPKGSAGVVAKIKIMAEIADAAGQVTASAEAVQTLNISKEYRLHLEMNHCGHVDSGENTILPLEDGSKAIDFYITSGEDYQFKAFADEGCIFEGWANEKGEILRTEEEIAGNLTDSLNLKAVFKDVTPPLAEISLTAAEKPEQGDGTDEILYSKEGITIHVTGEDHESGVKSIQYQIVQAGETYDKDTGWKNYTEPVTLTEDIYAEAYARVEDVDGNVTIARTKQFLIDKIGGKLILTPNFTSGEWTRKEDAQIHVLATEGVSPIKRITYLVDGKAYVREKNQFVIEGLQDGDYNVEVIAEDKAGHILTDTINVKKETVDTTIQVTGNPTELVREATLTAEVTTGVSGLKEITVNGKRIEGNTFRLKESENGTYVFAATSNGGSTATTVIEVTNMIIKVEDIQPEESRISLAVGKTHPIRWKVLPEDATYPQVVFASSNEELVTVDEAGIITAKKEGNAVITVTSVDNPGVSAEIAMDLFEEYKLHTSVDVGGKVEYNGNTLVTSEEGGDTEADVYLRKGTDYTLKAIPLDGYEFTGWKNEKGELVQKEAVISGKLMKDVNLYAEFRDNVPPTGEIKLQELGNPEEVEMLAILSEEPEVTCAYSSRGFAVTVESSDVPSGVKSVQYQVLDAKRSLDETKGWKAYQKPFTLEEDSDVIVYARIEDQDGNVTLIHSDEIMIDHEGISIEVQPNFTPGEWNHAKDNQIDVKVKENVTPVKQISYWKDEEEMQTEEKEFTISGLKDGDYKIRVQTEDAAGNQVEAVIPVKQDTSVPSVRILGNPTELVRSARLEIQAEPGISGLKEITVNGKAIEGNSYTAEENGSYEIAVTNQAGTTAAKNVDVTKVIVEVEEIQAEAAHFMLLNTNWQIAWKVLPAEADFQQVTFGSSNEKVAVVSENGIVTAKKAGKSVITITSADNPQVTKQISLTVSLPQIQVKAQSDQQILLTWKGAAGAKEYWVYRSEKVSGKFKRIRRVKESAYRDTKVKKGKTYYYKIQAIAEDQSCNGSLGPVTKGKACLQTPKSVKVTISGKNYRVRWSKSEGAKSYTIYRSAKQKGVYKRIGTSLTNSFTDRQFGIRKKWYYKVKAIGSKSKWNSSLSGSEVYKKPVSLGRVSVSLKTEPGAVGVSWKKISGADSYQVYRAESQWGVFTKIAETGKVAAWRDETVEKGKKYYYKVGAVTKKGKSSKKAGNTSKIVKIKAR